MSFWGISFSLLVVLISIFLSKIVFQRARGFKGYGLLIGILIVMIISFLTGFFNFVFYPLSQSDFAKISQVFFIHYSLLEITGYTILSYLIRKFSQYTENTLRLKIIFIISIISMCLSFVGFSTSLIFDSFLSSTTISSEIVLFVSYFLPSQTAIVFCCLIGFWLSIGYWKHKRDQKQTFPRLKMDIKGKKVCIFIPAYNAAYTLPNLIDRIQSDVRDQIQKIIVIDDHSPDNTYLLAVGLKKEQNLSKMSVFRTIKNQKYGGNQKLGYSLAILEDYDIVVMLHGDAQYAPELIPQIIEPIVNDEADMVFGSRMKEDPLKGGMPPIKYLGNKALTFVENCILGTNLSEFHSGYRAYSCDALMKIPFLRCTNEFHFDTEIIIQFVLAKLRIVEIPIPTFYGEEVSRVNKFSYGFDILKEMISYLIVTKGFAENPKFDLTDFTFSINDIRTYIEDFMVKID